MTLDGIERLTQTYADRRALLAERLALLQAQIDEVKKKHLKELKRHVALTAECESALRAAIEAAPELFEKPKTKVFHGVKVGYRKGPGALDWEDDGDLVRKIERYFGEEAEAYLIVKKKPSAEALDDLDAATLKRLGVQVGDDKDQVVVKAVESDVEKLMKALLKGALEEAEDAA